MNASSRGGPVLLRLALGPHVGDDEPAHPGLERHRPGLAGRDVRRPAFEVGRERRLAHGDVERRTAELSERPVRPRVGRVAERRARRDLFDAHRERLDRMVGQRERERQVARPTPATTASIVVHANVGAIGSPNAASSNDNVSAVPYIGSPSRSSAVLDRVAEHGQLRPVVRVRVRHDDGVEVFEGRVLQEVGQRARTAVDPHAHAAALDEVAAARVARPGVRAAAPEHGDAQAHHSDRRSASSSSGPSRRRPSDRNDATSPDEIHRCAPGPAPADRPAPDDSKRERHLEGRLVGRRHEHDPPPHHVADRTCEVGVVGAAEQQARRPALHARGRGGARPARRAGRCRSRPSPRTRRSRGTPRTSATPAASAPATARWYAPDAIVPTVAITPTRPGPRRRQRATARRVDDAHDRYRATRPAARRVRPPTRCCTRRRRASRRARRAGTA